MTTINIDNIEYDTDKLSDEAKAQLVSLQRGLSAREQ
jgi:hypothetical protein